MSVIFNGKAKPRRRLDISTEQTTARVVMTRPFKGRASNLPTA
jgi:hypothetical protein